MKYRATAFLLMTAGAAASAHAEYSGAYFGVAYSEIDLETANVVQGASANGDESDTRFFGGALFGKYFALEGGHVGVSGYDSGFTYEIPGNIPGFPSVDAFFKADYEVLTIRAIGKVPLGQFHLFAGVGGYHADFDADATWYPFYDQASLLESTGRSERGMTGIAGIGYRMGQATFRLDYEWFDMEPGMESSIVNLGISLQFR